MDNARPVTIPEAITRASDETLSVIAEVWALDVPHDATRPEIEGAVARWAGDAWVRGHASGEELIEMLGGARAEGGAVGTPAQRLGRGGAS